MSNETITRTWGIETSTKNLTKIPIEVMTCYRDVGVSNSELVLLSELASFRTHPNGATATPSLEALARRMGVTAQAVRQHVRRLENRGLLTVTGRRKEDRSLDTNLYDVSPFAKRCREVWLERKRGSSQLEGGAV